MSLKRGTWLFCAVVLSACVPLAPRPSAEQVLIAQRQWPEVTQQKLDRGWHEYLDRCAGCHVPYAPGKFPPDMWPKLVADMRQNASLTKPEIEQVIVQYLMSASAAQREARARGARR